MQFDDFDKKIIDAANHHHPAYDEKAWDRMEELLDKHLPVQKDNRRRIFFFLLLLVLVGSGAFFLIRGFNNPKSAIAKEQFKDPTRSSSTEPAAPVNSVPGKNETSAGDGKSAMKEEKTKVKATGTNSVPAADGKSSDNGKKLTETPAGQNEATVQAIVPGIRETQPGQSKTKKISNAITGAYTGTQKKVKKGSGQTGNGISHKNAPDANVTSDKNNLATEPGTTDNNTNNPASQNGPLPVTGTQSQIDPKNNITPKKDITVTAPDSVSQQQPGKNDQAQAETQQPVVSKQPVKKQVKQKRSFFAINLSAGPDLSYVGLSELGKVKMRYGAGLGYTFNHFTIRSGFYISKKIYSAEGTYYHPFYASLEKVDGDCKVFEIPVTVSYHFGQAKNHNWFASTGLSSYLMKKEDYVYHTKDPVSGNTNLYWKSWNNKNKHYFSVLNLSAGYERYFSKTLSVIAEPYMQIPFGGVGNGKMKLYSSGVQVTLSIKPFTRKK